MNDKLAEITENILNGNGVGISFEQAVFLAHLSEDQSLDLLYCANSIRKRFRDRPVICAIINAKSGLCSEDCAFCSQSAHHSTEIDIYSLMDKEKILGRAREMKAAGANRFSMVTSGVALTDRDLETVRAAAREIVGGVDITVCGSLGMLDQSRAASLRESGLSVYHHNLETARSNFDNICTTHSYDEDIDTVKTAKAKGMRVCSGGILGLGESWEQRVELAMTLRDLDVDGIPLNFLNPVAGTRMEKMPLLSPMEALKSISIFRFVNPSKDILICGGREVTLGDYQSWIFFAGANGFMIGNYLTTQGRDISMDMEMIKDFPL